MNVHRTVAELRRALDPDRGSKRRIGFVPTMGALHEGHISLVEKAAEENDTVVVSIFVNPIQFAPGEDFNSYPRSEARDLELSSAAGATHLFAPEATEMYPPGFGTEVHVSGLTEVLCGAPEARGSGHFSGVTTVVCKLLNAVQPDRAYFGQKDAQQVAVVRRMVRDLNIPVEIRALPTVREADGLAMSSRNRYLSAEDRERALAIPQALEIARHSILDGRSISSAIESAVARLEEAAIAPEYLEARDPDTLAPVTEAGREPVMFAVAARVGQARLIDNTVVEAQRIPQEVSSR